MVGRSKQLIFALVLCAPYVVNSTEHADVPARARTSNHRPISFWSAATAPEKSKDRVVLMRSLAAGLTCETDGECDDGNECTRDTCDSGACQNQPLLPGVLCGDDGNACTNDMCDGSGACIHSARNDGTPCGDPSNSRCNYADSCLSGVCAVNFAPAGASCDDDGNDCTTESCDGSGSCTHPAKPNGTPCGDPGSSECDAPDTCAGGVCASNHVVSGTLCADEGDPCTADACNGSGACAHTCKGDGAACDDGFACTTNDRCQGCVCQGDAVDCNDGVTCTHDECSEPGGCVHTPDDSLCPDAVFCDGPDSCVPTNPFSDADGCLELGAQCDAQAPLCCEARRTCATQCCSDTDCGGGLCCERGACGPCENVRFDPAVETVPMGVAAVFEVWLAPVELSAFQSADLVIASDDVSDFAFEYAESWLSSSLFALDPQPVGLYPHDLYVGGFLENPAGGPVLLGTLRVSTVGLAVGDYSLFVDGARDGGFSTFRLNEGQTVLTESAMGSVEVTVDEAATCDGLSCSTAVECDDGFACTQDVCVNGCCSNSPIDSICNDGLFCNGIEVCDVAAGCVPGTPPDCNDGIGCTLDACNEANDNCIHTPNNGACSNGQICDGLETCVAGVGCQAGTAPNCDDGVACTVDSCNESTDSCDHAPSDVACDDGLYCTGVETCNQITGCQAGTPPSCSDGVDCTIDSCDEAGDSCRHTPNDLACSDGQACNGTEVCTVGVGCQAGTAPSCDDGVACTVDACDEVNDVCSYSPTDATCDDGQFCNGVEVCNPALGCQTGTPPDCNDHVACTTDSCDEINDVCVHTPNDSLCDDAQFCNGLEHCDSVSGCEGGMPPNCDDGVTCTADACDESNDVCTHAPNDAMCSDGQYCNGAEVCDLIIGCGTGLAPDCNDGVGCTVDTCDETKDICIHAPTNSLCDDELFCNGAEICDSVIDCQAGTPPNCNDGVDCTEDSCDESNDVCANAPTDTLCDDGAFCNGSETCDALNGCEPGTPPNCADGLPCTVDTCDEVNNTCLNAPNDTVCNDSQFCNGEETCDPAKGCLTGTPPNCDDGVSCTVDTCDEVNDACVLAPTDSLCGDGMFCNGVEFCDAILDCQSGSAPDCDDGVGCTFDSCDEANDVCVNDPDDSACDDGAFCNGQESCDPINGCTPGSDPCSPTLACDEGAGACVDCLKDADCDDDLYCNGAESCDAGTCVPGIPPDCDDGVDCTVDSCDEAVDMCMSTPTDSSCNDGQYCNGVETCDPITGCVAGLAPDCDDAVDCTADSCDEVNDVCVNAPSDAACDDGQFCNGVESCDSRLGCQVGLAPECDDGVSCTADLCDETKDTCEHIPQHEVCDNNLFCDGTETCDPLNDCQSGTPPDCNDKVGCTIDSCDELSDMCVHAPDDAACDDAQFCNGIEMCDSLQGCLAGTPPTCDDGVSCTIDNCSESTDACTHQSDDSVCSNGAFCDGVERCDPASDCLPGLLPDCDDGFDCTVDTCDEAKDVCRHTPDDLVCDDGIFCNGMEACVDGQCLSGGNPCDEVKGCCDESSQSCFTSLLADSFPLPDQTLWRRLRNRIRLSFHAPEFVPSPESVQVRALLPDGMFGPDIATGFAFSTQASDLVITGTPPSSLENQTWYKVSWCAALSLGTCCSADFLVQMGDANNDGMVSFADLNEAFLSVPTRPSSLSELNMRRDISGDNIINFADLAVANQFIPGSTIPKPDGHD